MFISVASEETKLKPEASYIQIYEETVKQNQNLKTNALIDDWGSQLERILNKLERENLVFKERDATYKITFDGYYKDFIGGYEEASKSLDEEKRLQFDFQIQAEVNAKRLNRLTSWLSVGSFLLALVEIIKIFLHR